MPIDPRLDLELPASDRVHGERPGEAVVAKKAQRLLAPARPSPTVPDDGAERVVAVADDRRGDRDPVADAGLGRPAAAVHLRRDVGDHDPRGGHARHTVNSSAVRLERSLGVQLHPTSLPGGRLGPDAYAFVDWLHEAGGAVVAGASTHPAGHLRIALYIGIRVRRLGRPPRRPGGAGRPRRGARVPRARGRLARRLGGVRGRRRPRGAGALRARVGRASRLCRGSGRAGRRRPADLRRGGRLRPRGTPRALPPPRGGRRRRAAGRPQRARPALGKSALRLGRARADGIPLVDRPDAPRAGPRRPLPARPLPRLRRVLGRPGGRQERPRRSVATGTGSGGVRRSARRARRPPGRRGGPRCDHTGRP